TRSRSKRRCNCHSECAKRRGIRNWETRIPRVARNDNQHNKHVIPNARSAEESVARDHGFLALLGMTTIREPTPGALWADRRRVDENVETVDRHSFPDRASR